METQATQDDAPTEEPVAARDARQRIDVGGRRLALVTSGRGTPAVLLETGLGAESDEWSAVQSGIARLTTVCRYDRAGRGDSEAAATPRTADAMIDDLRSMLRRAGIAPPYVLVGQSFGGLLVRRYAHRHHAEVAGIVLVDAMHEDQFDLMAPQFPPRTATESPQFAGLRAFWTSGWRDPASTAERIEFVETLRQAREVRSLGDIPLRVLTARSFLTIPGVPPDRRADLQQRWDELQRSFTRLSTQAQQAFVSGGHFLQRDAPEAIIAAVEDVVETWRRRQRRRGDVVGEQAQATRLLESNDPGSHRLHDGELPGSSHRTIDSTFADRR